MTPGPRVEKLIADAKARIKEITPVEAAAKQATGAILIDVRDGEDFGKSHATGAVNLSRGTIELKIEQLVPSADAAIVCYCGGGSRSALATDSLQKMGYTNVASVIGGFKAWKEANLPTE